MTAPALLAVVAAAGLLVLLVRARRLEERHAVLWIAVACVAAVTLAAGDPLADAVGVSRAEATLAVGLAAALVLLLAAYAVIARLAAQSRVLAQRLALLEERTGDRGAAGGAR
jgi:uncharacterized membrane-anchored protein